MEVAGKNPNGQPSIHGIKCQAFDPGSIFAVQPTWIHYIIAVFAGMLAGFINTLAGSGSLITLPMLIFLGLPANVANATNRIGIFCAALVGTWTFRKGGHLSIRMGNLAWLFIPIIGGSIVGAQVAAKLSAQAMHQVIGVVMIIMLAVILIKPKHWLVEATDAFKPRHHVLLTVAIFFLIGVYGGLVQAGVGILLLVALVLYAKYSLVQANGLKVLTVLVFTAPALAIFIWNDQVNWPLGLLLALGQCIGAWIGARLATRHKHANLWIRRLLILIVCLSILKLFGVLDMMLQLTRLGRE